MGNEPLLRTSAPGKLFLFGEYGVLAGGACVVAAVNRRVFASRHKLARGYEALGAEIDDASVLPEAVLHGLSSGDVPELGQLSTDIRQLYTDDSTGTGEKLGLGSSAASSVALSLLCLLESPATDIDLELRARIFEHAFAAHRRLQGGRGSGADVAASSFGGILGYRLAAPAAPFEGRLESADLGDAATSSKLSSAEIRRHLTLPDELRVEAVWLGRPALSTHFVHRCEQQLARSPRRTADLLAQTSQIAGEALEALSVGDGGRICQLVSRADRVLEALGEHIAAPIICAAHRALRATAAPAGIHIKPSGAGGGDFSLAVAPADAPWKRFLTDLPEGCRHLPLQFGAPGARAE